MAQTHALRAQLRPYCQQDGDNQAVRDRDRFLTLAERTSVANARNAANTLLQIAGTAIGGAYSSGTIDSIAVVQCGQLVDSFCAIQTACERIHNTSLPIAYSLLVHRTAFLYTVLAPFAMVSIMGWWTILFTAVIAYTFFGLDELARQIQEPFSDEPQCLALSAMCRTVEVDVCECLGGPVPPYLKAHAGTAVLM